MHDDVVVDQGHISRLPRNIKDEFFGQITGQLGPFVIHGAAVSKRQRLGWGVPGVFPAGECGDQLIEERGATVIQRSNRGQGWGWIPAGTHWLAIPRCIELRQSGLGVVPWFQRSGCCANCDPCPIHGLPRMASCACTSGPFPHKPSQIRVVVRPTDPKECPIGKWKWLRQLRRLGDRRRRVSEDRWGFGPFHDAG